MQRVCRLKRQVIQWKQQMKGALLTVEGDFTERDGALEFAFDKKGNIESLT